MINFLIRIIGHCTDQRNLLLQKASCPKNSTQKFSKFIGHLFLVIKVVTVENVTKIMLKFLKKLPFMQLLLLKM